MLDQDTNRNRKTFIRDLRTFEPLPPVNVYDADGNFLRTRPANYWEDIVEDERKKGVKHAY